MYKNVAISPKNSHYQLLSENEDCRQWSKFPNAESWSFKWGTRCTSLYSYYLPVFFRHLSLYLPPFRLKSKHHSVTYKCMTWLLLPLQPYIPLLSASDFTFQPQETAGSSFAHIRLYFNSASLLKLCLLPGKLPSPLPSPS